VQQFFQQSYWLFKSYFFDFESEMESQIESSQVVLISWVEIQSLEWESRLVHSFSNGNSLDQNKEEFVNFGALYSG